MNTKLLLTDLRNIRRDPLLALCAVLPVLIALALRVAWPLIPYDLSAHEGALGSFSVLAAAMMLGWIVGFLILDERDAHILELLVVTPLGRRGFLVARLGAVMVACGLIAPIAGLLAPNTWTPLALAAASILAAVECPILAVSLATAARNKVEGLAVAKLMTLPFVAVLAVFYLPESWSWCFAPLPPFWIAKLAQDPGPVNALGGAVVHAIWLAVAVRWFSRARLAQA